MFPKRHFLSVRRFVRQYHKNIIEHYENPRNVGSLNKNETSVGTGLVGCASVWRCDENAN